MKVLVVCHGNINRSPLAAAVIRKERPDWEVREAALKSWCNPDWKPERAAKKMRDAAAQHGYDLEDHRSRAITEEDMDWADQVIYMDGGNFDRLLAIRPTPGPGRGWVNLASLVGRPRIPDPAFMAKGSAQFDEVVSLIIRAAQEATKKLIAQPF
jgi:protein-tyrosine phosphatase